MKVMRMFLCTLAMLGAVARSQVMPPDKKVLQTTALVKGLCAAVAFYHTEYNRWPDSADIFATIQGENPRKIRFFEGPEKSILPDGTVTDPWGHPYIFDGIVDGEPRFHSAGPDGVDQHGAKGSDDIVSWR